MSLLLSRAAGPQAKVLVDTGHHYAAQNIEQIVAWLLSEDMLGGFHFNDRRYADDDLTLGSIDPYQVFRIFHEIHSFEWETGKPADIAYMIDQSHNLKGKIEEAIQTVTMAQQLFAKAALVDHEELSHAQINCDLVAAESMLQDAFNTDVRPVIQEWRDSKGLPRDPLKAFLREWIHGAHHERTRRAQFTECFFLCLTACRGSLIWRSILAPRADGPSWRIFSREFSPPRKSIDSPTNPSNTADRFTGTWLDSGSKCAKLFRGLGEVELAGIGVDAWGVDYALLGERGELLQNPYHYRDRRTEGCHGRSPQQSWQGGDLPGDWHSVHAHQHSVSTFRRPASHSKDP